METLCPAPLAAVTFDPSAVRADIRRALRIAHEHGCVIEVILKDTHTCNNDPGRFDRWAELAMEEARESV